MNSLAIGVDEPHITLSTTPCEIAACRNAGAVSGVKSRMIAAAVTGRLDELRG